MDLNFSKRMRELLIPLQMGINRDFRLRKIDKELVITHSFNASADCSPFISITINSYIKGKDKVDRYTHSMSILKDKLSPKEAADIYVNTMISEYITKLLRILYV